MKNANTALLLVDIQNDFLDENGILSKVVKEQVQNLNLVEKINNLINNAREEGVKIFHAPIAFSSTYSELGQNPYGVAKIVKESGAFKEGERGAMICSKINLTKDDVVLPFKKSISAFKTTNLDGVLRTKGINTLVIAGLLTDACMLATVIEGYDLGYNIITVKNLNAATSVKSREDVINNIFPLFSNPMEDSEVISLFKK